MFMPKDFSLNPEFRANLPRTGHNLGHDFGFTATVGHLLPVIHDIVNPGETVSMSFNYDIRTMPLQQAAMTKLKVHTEYFFVPMQLLYEPFGSLYYGINDQFSSNFMSKNSLKFPLINWADFYDTASESYSTATEFSEAYGKSWMRLLDMFGLNPVLSSTQDANGYQPNIFPWQILAYNCIYQYYYRIDERQRFVQESFNVDRFYNSDYIDSNYIFLNCGMKYRPFDDDYFTSIHVSPIVGPRNLKSATENLDLVNSYLSRSFISGSTSVLSPASVGSDIKAPSPLTITDEPFTSVGFQDYRTPNPPVNGVDINTANIRAMFANEKLWSITGRARKHYDDQTLAHFGYDVPHDVKHEITCFGHDVSEIGIGEVISTASTDTAPLGEIAGKGYGSSKNAPHKFTAPCHGVVMCIMSVTPKRSYFDTYLKVNALTSMNDLYKPELDHLGQQPLFGYELKQTSTDNAAQIFGWQYRYEQYKRRYNRLTRAFEDGAGLSSWMTGYNPYTRWQNVPTSQYNTDTGLEFAYLPTMINGIMLPQYSLACTEAEFHNPSLIYANDPFVVDSHVTYDKVSTMSDYSLPRLDA